MNFELFYDPFPSGTPVQILSVFFLVATQKRDANGFDVAINAGFTRDFSSVEASGSIQHIITNPEAETFGINGNNLKNAYNKFFGKTPDNAFLRSPALCTLINCKEDLYQKFANLGWEEVSTVLNVVSSSIVEFDSKPITLQKKTSVNNSNKNSTFNVGISTSVENTASSQWSNTDTISVSQAIKYGIEFLGTGGGGTTTLAYTHEWGKGGSESKTTTVGSTHGATIELGPGETAVVELKASQGFMKVQVVYEASLRGCAVAEYRSRYRGHHHYCYPINEILSAARVSNSKKFTETINIAYYGDSTVTVTSTKSKVRSFHEYIGKLTVPMHV